VKNSDLKAEAQRLIDSGETPDLETVLNVIVKVRKKYAKRILAARKEADANKTNGQIRL
jgi:hypothetical protein